MARLGERKPEDEIKKNVVIVLSNNDITQLINVQNHMVASSRSDCIRRLINSYLKSNNINGVDESNIEKQFKVPDKMSRRYSIYLRGNESAMLKAVMIKLRVAAVSECIRALISKFVGDNNIDVNAMKEISPTELYIGLTDEQIKMLQNIEIGGKGRTLRLFMRITDMGEDDVKIAVKKGYVKVKENKMYPDFDHYIRVL
jgi:hypothetical protein